MGKKVAFKNIVNKIEDDYIRRMEDFYFQQKIEENGFKYGKVFSAYHIHQKMSSNDEKELIIELKYKRYNKWLLRMIDEQFRATIKYLSPKIKVNVNMAIVSMDYILNNSTTTYKDLIKWVKKTNPKWIKYIKKNFIKQRILHFMVNVYKRCKKV